MNRVTLSVALAMIVFCGSPAIAKELCFKASDGRIKCFEVGSGTSGGGCGSNSECGGNNYEVKVWPGYRDFLDGAKRQRSMEKSLEIYDKNQSGQYELLNEGANALR